MPLPASRHLQSARDLGNVVEKLEQVIQTNQDASQSDVLDTERIITSKP